MNRSVYFFPILLLLLLTLLTFWIDKAVQVSDKKADGSARHDPDYKLKNFVTTKTDINGELRYKLAAVEMIHYPDDDTTQLIRPRFTRYAVDKPYTQIEGQQGFVSSDGSLIEITDQVRLVRQAYAGRGEMVLLTDKLTIDPKQETAKTDSPVRITQAPKTLITARGLMYDKKNKTLKLLHKVRAHYERPAKKLATLRKKGAGFLTMEQKINAPADYIAPRVTPKPSVKPKTKLQITKDFQ